MNGIGLTRKKEFKPDLFFILAFAAAAVFCLWKVPFGLGGDDEAFYLTIPLRLLQGDALLVDEYHLSQLSAFLLYPLAAVYKFFVPSLDGIILAFRYLYVLFHCATAIIIYSRVRKYGLFGTFAVLFYMLYTPYNIMALSYNTMGLGLVTLTGILLATSDPEKNHFLYILCGLLFAGAVLCNPYLAAVFVLFSAAVLIFAHVKKNRNITRSLLLFTVGVIALAVVFIGFLLSRASISEIIKALPALFTDPDHPSISIGTKLYYYFSTTLSSVPVMQVLVPLHMVSIIFIALDNNRKKHRLFHMILPAIIVVIYLIECLPESSENTYNFIMYPLTFCGINAFLLTEKRNYPLFVFVYLLGYAYSVCMCFSSNQYFYIISAAMTATNVGSILLMAELFREMKEEKDYTSPFYLALCGILIICQLGIICYSKATHMFWMFNTPSELTAEYTVGPAKGIKTTETAAASYEAQMNDLEILRSKTDGSVLYASRRTRYYLSTPILEFGTFSAWLSGETPAAAQRLSAYYELNPSHIPDYVYVPFDADWTAEDIYEILSCAEYNYTYLAQGTLFERVK